MEIILRKTALASGLKRYFTGKPCKYGHIAERYVNIRRCVECTIEYEKKWSKKNPDKRRAISKAWRKRNPEKCRELDLRWYAANPNKKIQHNKRWAQANPDKANAISRNRRARARDAFGTHTAADVSEIFKAQKYKCPYCGIGLTQRKKHVDHIIPLVLGGSNERRNIQVLCQPCNNKKHAKHPVDYARSIGMLL